jgi:hypothetical protein
VKWETRPVSFESNLYFVGLSLTVSSLAIESEGASTLILSVISLKYILKDPSTFFQKPVEQAVIAEIF